MNIANFRSQDIKHVSQLIFLRSQNIKIRSHIKDIHS